MWRGPFVGPRSAARPLVSRLLLTHTACLALLLRAAEPHSDRRTVLAPPVMLPTDPARSLRKWADPSLSRQGPFLPPFPVPSPDRPGSGAFLRVPRPVRGPAYLLLERSARHLCEWGFDERTWPLIGASHSSVEYLPAFRRASPEPRCRAMRSFFYSIISVTTPEPTVRPPSRIANRSCGSIAIGVISSTSICTLSPGITISTPSGRCAAPVTSVVRK